MTHLCYIDTTITSEDDIYDVRCKAEVNDETGFLEIVSSVRIDTNQEVDLSPADVDRILSYASAEDFSFKEAQNKSFEIDDFDISNREE